MSKNEQKTPVPVILNKVAQVTDMVVAPVAVTSLATYGVGRALGRSVHWGIYAGAGTLGVGARVGLALWANSAAKKAAATPARESDAAAG